MAQKTIPQLTEITDVTASAIIPVDSGVQTFKMTAPNVGKMALVHGPKNLFVSVWASTYTYALGDVVASGEDFYISLKNTNLNKAVSNGVWWRKISTGGINPQVNQAVATRALAFGAASGSYLGFNHPAYSPELQRWVVGTQNGDLYYSDDNGQTWTQATEPLNSENTTWNECAWSPERKRFVAVGFDNSNGSSTNQIAYSDDGETWTAATNPDTSNGYLSVLWLAEYGRFVASGQLKATGSTDDAVIYSEDGETWTKVTAESGSWNSLAYSPSLNRLVAFSVTASGPEGDTVMFSDDGGDTWEIVLVPGYALKRGFRVEELGLFFITTANDVLLVSADGETWEEIAIPSASSDTWVDFAWSPELGAIICTGQGRDLLYSFGGSNWTRVTDALPNDGSGTNWSACEWSAKGGHFMAFNRIVTASVQQTLSTHVKEFIAV